MVIINEYTSNFKAKFINDSIYGGIGLSKLEVDLINTPIFQRLRNLRQLAFINYIFPCAEHSRFVHSLGVLYIMGRITDHLFNRGDITIEDVIKLRIAALLHDIGHYPLSHLVEGVYCYKEDIKKRPKIVGNVPQGSLLSSLGQKIKKRAHHEQLGKFIIQNNSTISKLLTDVGLDPIEIGNIITGEVGAEDGKLIYSQLMHSSLDADRLDYLLRDSSQTGVRYGFVDLDYLIRLLQVVKDYHIDLNGEKKVLDIIACNIKGQHVVEHYLMSRYFHYSQVINHKTGTSFEAVAKVMIYKLIEAEKFIFNSYDEIKAQVNKDDFLKFTDSTLFGCLDDYYKRTHDKDFIKFYDIIFGRKRPKTLIEIKDIVKKEEKTSYNDLRYYNLKRILINEPQKIADILRLDKEYIGFKEFEIAVESIPAHMTIEGSRDEIEEGLREAIRLVDENGQVTLLALDGKSLINKLADYVSKSLRVFYIEPDDCNTESLYEEAKNKIQKFIQE